MAASVQSRQPPPPSRSALRPRSSTLTLRHSPIDRDPESMRDTVPTPSPKQAYFDKYPRRPERMRSKDKIAEGYRKEELIARSMATVSKHITPDKEPKEVYLWPSVSLEHVDDSSTPSPKTPTARTKVLNAPSDNDSTLNFFIRSSTSSTYTQTTLNDNEGYTPPRTPESTPPQDGVLVASGVEMMDALVDQMNGGHDVDSGFFPSLMRKSAKQDKNANPSSLQMRHHPLYHPPLPPTPKGVKLGKQDTSMDADDDSSSPQKRPIRQPGSRSSKTPVQPPKGPIRSASETTLRMTRSRGTTDLAEASTSVPSSTPSSSTSHRRPPSREKDREREPRKDRPRTRDGEKSSRAREKSQGPSSESLGRSNRTLEKKVADLKAARSVENLVKASPPPDLKPTKPSVVIPSINDIIRAHAPAYARPLRSTLANHHPPSSYFLAPNLPLLPPEDDDIAASRSSIDSIGAEVQDSIKKAPHLPSSSPRPLHHAKSFGDRPCSRAASVPSKEPPLPSYAPYGVKSPRSEGYDGGSVYSGTTSIGYSTFAPYGSPIPPSPTHEMAQFLRSPRLTRLMTLRRHPHAGLQVSLADVGSSTGHPVLVYLGLGCVRYLIALYDEMAEALGLRLLCIDRWGLGRTGEAKEGGRGLLEWASVVEEVADTLDLKEFSVIAHSAGAPYALASTLKMGTRIKGSVHLLAPWVSSSVDGGYKWLKFVPNGLIKTAQAAEWKMQGWMLGKPPTITYQAIGYDATAAAASPPSPPEQSLPTPIPDQERVSISTSEYDDLADFQGQFESHGTLPTVPDEQAEQKKNKKPVKGFMALFGASQHDDKSGSRGSGFRANSLTGGRSLKSPPVAKSPKLKGLKSLGSLRNGNEVQSASLPSNLRRGSEPMHSMKLNLADLPPPPVIGLGLGLDGMGEWGVAPPVVQKSKRRPKTSATLPRDPSSVDLSRTRRSLSLTVRSSSTAPSSSALPPGVPYLPLPSPFIDSNPSSPNPSVSTGRTAHPSKPTITLADALLRASHAESLKGGTADLLAILERDSKPWGFSYADVRHPCKVWYGDRDEKITISSVHWMERVMKDCSLKIVKGGGHGLMTNTDVVVEVLESIAKEWGRVVPSSPLIYDMYN